MESGRARESLWAVHNSLPNNPTIESNRDCGMESESNHKSEGEDDADSATGQEEGSSSQDAREQP